ncbi:hypothetical protein Smic_02280 [Streptomyces microflavus]|uniref:Uncharacterized protein n=1 Tax=Streptomyces microflavus TaxID=1919 RepID=A0A7J0CGU4_STRMI|nr:hypothetical protein Smic_02280 [Streptomyces microflavus]
MSQHIDPGEPEVVPQGFHVRHLTVAAVGGGIVGEGRPAGAAQVEEDEAAVRGEAPEITQIAGVGRASRKADQRFTLPGHAIGEPGSVRCREEGSHGSHDDPYNQVVQPGYKDRVIGV